jgi:arsenite methyltransferase
METITDIVRDKYAEAARRVTSGAAASCGTSPSLSACCATGPSGSDPITSNLYGDREAGEVPDTALLASLGCGNPTALAQLHQGETVLDLGSGGGIDVILSARRVGPSGKAYGLDMTDEMLALAEDNKRKAGIANVEFLKGQIEAVPLPAAAVDVIISNCVINLSADKDQVLAEAFRVLKPGGRFAVSDVVIRGEIPEAVRRSMQLWVGCVAGALTEDEYRAKLLAAGFEDVEIETTRVYDVEDARAYLSESGLDVDAIAPIVNGRVTSAFVRAKKPAAKAACCGPTCCA